MTTRKYWLLGIAAIAVLLLARAFLFAPAAPDAKRPNIVQSPQPASEEASSKRALTGAPTPAAPAASKKDPGVSPDAYPYKNPDDPHKIFENATASLDERFSMLAHLATGGNLQAKYLALLIARHCAAVSKTPDDQPPAGKSEATSYQVQLRAQMKAACAQVESDPDMAEYAQLLESHAIEEFAEKMHQTIQLYFADKGPDAALHAAVSALAQRPDDATVEMVDNALADLDLSSDYLQQKLASVAPADPKKRNALMRFALNLLACSYGRACGPNSFVVQTTCTELGACMPGADLLGVYQSQMLNARDMAYVSALVQYLKQIPTNMVWN